MPGPNSRLGTWTNVVNLCDLAAWAVPSGVGEGRLATLADQVHRAATTSVGNPAMPLPPPAPPSPVAPDETALFCTGAHMAGLPLNAQLTERGGRFIAAARTRPGYRLFALGDRPGLLAAPGSGAIAGEIWALPTTAIGALLGAIPRPFGLGTVMLEAGPCLGFLAEAEGVAGATDITHHGGWRAYLAATDEAAGFIQAGSKLLGLPIDPAWHDGVAFHLRTILAQAATVGAPEPHDPAPLFHA